MPWDTAKAVLARAARTQRARLLLRPRALVNITVTLHVGATPWLTDRGRMLSCLPESHSSELTERSAHRCPGIRPQDPTAQAWTRHPSDSRVCPTSPCTRGHARG